MKADVVGMAVAQPAQRVIGWLAPLLRPLRPCASIFARGGSKAAKHSSEPAASPSDGGEIGAAGSLRLSQGNSDTPRAMPRSSGLQSPDNPPSRLRAAEKCPAQVRHQASVELRDRLDVDVERVEEQPAVQRVGAAWSTPGGRGTLRVQWLPDLSAPAKSAADVQQRHGIGEIAVAPVAPRPQGVKLHRQHPRRFPAIALVGWIRPAPPGRRRGTRRSCRPPTGPRRCDRCAARCPRHAAGPAHRNSSGPMPPRAASSVQSTRAFRAGLPGGPVGRKTIDRPISSGRAPQGNRAAEAVVERALFLMLWCR